MSIYEKESVSMTHSLMGLITRVLILVWIDKISYPSMSFDKCAIIKFLYALMQKYNLDVAK